MDARRVYLDCNGTAPLRQEAREAALAALDLAANPSAVHRQGRQARQLIEEAREMLALLVGAAPRNVMFTSGGSEGAATLLAPGFKGRDGQPASRLIVSAIEHSAVLAGGRFGPENIDVCPVTADGVIDIAALEDLLKRAEGRALVALMLANNETGIIQPVEQVAELARNYGGAVVCDAVQAIGKMPVDLAALGVDALILSGHKLGAPQGTGAVILAEGASLASALIKGGAQEMRRRAGTENVSGIAGLGAACRVAIEQGEAEQARMAELRDDLELRLGALPGGCEVLGAHVPRLPNTSLVIAEDVVGETAVIALDLAGVAVATGSACTSGKVAPSHVLAAMGVSAQKSRAALRISLGWSTTKADIDIFLAAFASHRQRVAERARAA